MCTGGHAQGASSLDSSLTLASFGGDAYLGDCDDVSLDDVLLPDEDLLDLAPDEPMMKVRRRSLRSFSVVLRLFACTAPNGAQENVSQACCDAPAPCLERESSLMPCQSCNSVPSFALRPLAACSR
jgi:hypothetical protein